MSEKRGGGGLRLLFFTDPCFASLSSAVLGTGANRGIGRALVNEALTRGVKRVYAGSRVALQHADERVTPLTLDVTNVSQIQRAADEIGHRCLAVMRAQSE